MCTMYDVEVFRESFVEGGEVTGLLGGRGRG